MKECKVYLMLNLISNQTFSMKLRWSESLRQLVLKQNSSDSDFIWSTLPILSSVVNQYKSKKALLFLYFKDLNIKLDQFLMKKTCIKIVYPSAIPSFENINESSCQQFQLFEQWIYNNLNFSIKTLILTWFLIWIKYHEKLAIARTTCCSKFTIEIKD